MTTNNLPTRTSGELARRRRLADVATGMLPQTGGLADVWAPPPGQDIVCRSSGEWWDAVRVHEAIGERVIEELGTESGAVIRDVWGRHLYWLIPVHGADDWSLQPGVPVLEESGYLRILGEASYVAVPAGDRVGGIGVSWAVPPARGRCLTSPEPLRAALQNALDDALGHREP